MILTQFIIAAVAIVFSYFILHFYRLKNYWKNRGISGPENKLFGGVLDRFDNKKKINVFQMVDWTEKYGKNYGFVTGSRKMLVTSDLDMLNELFVKKFEYFHGRLLHPLLGNVDDYSNPRVNLFNGRGNRWKRLRNIANPFFNVVNLKLIHPTVQDSVNGILSCIEKTVGQEIDSYRYFQEFTMDIISRIALGQTESKMFNNSFLDDVRGFFELKDLGNLEKLGFMFPGFMSSIVRTIFSLGVARGIKIEKIRHNLRAVIKQRKIQRQTAVSTEEKTAQFDDGEKRRVDYIDLFLDIESNDLVKDSYSKLLDKQNFKVEKKLTTDEVTALCQVFLLAGYDTTATSIAYVVHELAVNPECQTKLQQEIDDNGVSEEPTYEDIQKLRYLDAVVKESLRVHPLAARAASRECMEPTNLGDIQIEKGVFIQADVFSIHNDKSIWGNDADKFNPDRWLTDEKRHPMAWLPFGAGPRTCVGMRLAYLEEKNFLISCLKRFNILRSQNTPDQLTLCGALVVAPESVKVKFEARQ